MMQLPIMDGNMCWNTKYLHAKDVFQKQLPKIHDKLVGAMEQVDKEQGWGLLGGSETNVRCVEFHHIEDGGALNDEGHKDTGSLVTIDCMLSDPSSSEFIGGEFYTHRMDGGVRAREYQKFEQGDALIFPSHKHHVRSASLSSLNAYFHSFCRMSSALTTGVEMY
jgi:hypothetical protein